MGILWLCLEVFLFFRATSASNESLVIVGGTIGTWPDGVEIAEVEVWSPSPECGINIKDPPVTFPDYPAVAFFGGSLYVCGGQISEPPYYQDNITLMNTCYVYNMADNEWTEGPTLKFTADETYPVGLNFELWLATVGNSLVSVYKQDYYGQIHMSTLVDNEWSKPIVVERSPLEKIFSMVAIDEKHFALLQATLHSDSGGVEIINVETGSAVVKVPMDWTCFHGFLYNGQFSCIKTSYDGSQSTHEIRSLSFKEDFNDPTWSLAYDPYVPYV